MADVHRLPVASSEAVSSDDLASAVASRICHDLASPLGAIANGLELLAASGAAPTPEMDLIAQSAAGAGARLRFFRLAYGAPGDRPVSQSEIRDLLAALSATGRWKYHWNVAGPLARSEAKAVLLAAQCLESALPHGGKVDLARHGSDWTLEASGPRLTARPEDWASSSADVGRPVQFRLLAASLATLGRTLTLDAGPERLRLRF